MKLTDRGTPKRHGKVATIWGFLLVIITILLTAAAPGAGAQLLERLADQEIKQTLRIRKGSSKVLKTAFPITRISVANPEVADIVLISEREIYINALDTGVTNLSLWGRGRFTSATVVVEADVTLLREKLHQVLPREKIAVEACGDSVVLKGEVSGPAIQETALVVALPFVGGKKERVVNLLGIGGVQQVLLEVRLAEISRSVGERIGVNFNVIDRTGTSFGISQLNNLTTVTDFIRTFAGTAFTTTLSPNVNALFGFKTGTLLWTYFLDVLKRQGLGRVLAEPNLVTTSGQEASFLAGGEFPIPVPQPGGGGVSITVEFKKFGVGLIFTPIVLDEGKIAMRVNPEVSELDFTIGTTLVLGGTPVPGLRVRRLSTHVEMKEGQTFAIAGLLDDSHRNIVNKFPVLGELPILGTLFRSQEFQKRETELVVLCTPWLVKPMTATAARLPTDKYVEPNDFEFYLLGAQEGRQKQPKTSPPPPENQNLPPGFGNQPVE
ncbi:MAG: type II and III secretion system protein family protein [Deltaproteobacteria bacterium]|nr:type II and III secretion system protein family protein [Deltaproteobacteria bacterium]